MAKPKARFQEMVQHEAFIDHVRTDIRIHCYSEPLLKKLITTINLDAEDFSETFSSPLPKPIDKKNSRKAKQNLLKLIVGVYLNLLFSKSKLDDLKEQIDTKEFDQHEIIKFKTSHPTAAQMHMNFAKQITPERAIEFLDSLKKNTLALHQDLVNYTEQHRELTEEYLEQYTNLVHEFDERLRGLQYTLSHDELTQIFKLLGELNEQ